MSLTKEDEKKFQKGLMELQKSLIIKNKRKDKFALKVNYVRVVDELLKIKEIKEIVENTMIKYARPYYYDLEKDRKDFEKEQYDRGFKGDYNDW